MLRLTLDIKPKPSQGAKGMKIVGRPGGKQWIQVYETAELREWKNKVLVITKKSMKEAKVRMLTGPLVIVGLEYQFQANQTVMKTYRSILEAGGKIYNQNTPDITDNLQKGFIDALKMVLFDRDEHIVHMNNVWKCWGLKDQITMVIDTLPDLIMRFNMDDVIAEWNKRLTDYPLKIG